jgi:hypothetical protein
MLMQDDVKRRAKPHQPSAKRAGLQLEWLHQIII